MIIQFIYFCGASESGTGTSATSHTSTEAASAEATASSAEASATAKDDRTSSATSAIVFIIRLFAAYYLVSAVAASVGNIIAVNDILKSSNIG